MVQAEIAAKVVSGLLKAGKPLTRENLRPVNKRYVEAQGRAFEARGEGRELQFSTGEMLRTAARMVLGVVTCNLWKD